MRVPSSYTRRQSGSGVAMTPMIDVVFLLLIFFVWTASFQVVEFLLPSRLIATAGESGRPSHTPPPPDFDRVVVRIFWEDGNVAWTINDDRVDSLAQVRERLGAVAQIKNDVPLVIDPGGDVPLGHVIDVYDVSRLAGFQKIQFAASEAI